MYISIVMCIIHLFNTSIIHIFSRTQVLHMVQKFSKNFNKFFFTQHALCNFILLPQKLSRKFPKFFLKNLKPLSLLILRCLKFAIVQVLLLSELLASASLVTFVENELSLEP